MTVHPGIDLASESFFADPFPTFERLRAEAPIYFFEPMQCFLLSAPADIEAMVKDPRFTARRTRELLAALGMLGEDELSKKMLDSWSRIAFSQDPPRHTRLRQLIARGFSPAAVESLRPRVAATVGRAIARARDEGEMNVLSDLAEVVAITTIADMFSIPDADRPAFMRWSTDIVKPTGGNLTSDEVKRTVKQSTSDMADYMARLVEERRKAPRDDVASRFIAAEEESADLQGEAAMQCFQMVGAGFVTSMNQIANTVVALLKHPEALARLRQDPGLLRGAIEEGLRCEPAVLSINRLCAEDAEIRGVRIAKGGFVFAMTAAVGCDPELFPEPRRFDITRQPNRHMTFGSGVHYCPGAPLIRIEVEEALRGLLSLGRWELAEERLSYEGSNFQDRGPKSLRVRFS
ncbi:cytochrome P450 [Sorangium cellulosum]|uniref:Cytochrome P450 n=2 Tax=Sorangium cellulosum TaxID=56 RepID=A0A2L0EZE0_SORCE|nr:cytochrome P450 [Sorangium cellulosum]